MTREITAHQGDAGPNLLFQVMADTWHPGDKKREAPIRYEVWTKNVQGGREGSLLATLRFQDGPMMERLPDDEVRMLPPNGLTNEVLLAIVLDRLLRYQTGDYVSGVKELDSESEPVPMNGKTACPENAEAIVAVQTALDLMHRRTMTRIVAGTEGTKTP